MIKKENQASSTQEARFSKDKANNLLYRAVAIDGRSFSDFEKKGLFDLLFHLNNNYKPPCRQTIANNMKNLYINHKEKYNNKYE